jgi:protein TonB
MSTTAMTLGLRPRPRSGPALRRFTLPYGPLAVSVCVHAALAAGLVAGAVLWPASPTRTYVVNLVPAVAAVGAPQGRPTPEAPSRVAPAPPRPIEPAAPKELPTALALPDRGPSAAPPALPDRGPASSPAVRPDRPLPSRMAAPTLPRPGDKERPNVAVAPTPKAPPTPTPVATPPPASSAPPAAAPLGSPSGSPQGAGALTLNVSDFPYAWYVQAIHRKIQERWEGRAIEGRQPEIIFEIGREGHLRRVTVGKTSGNPAYDQLARRAVSEANPFPPLPAGFEKPTLTVGLQFIYDPRTR